jgi:hypothetical protein
MCIAAAQCALLLPYGKPTLECLMSDKYIELEVTFLPYIWTNLFRVDTPNYSAITGFS